MYIEKIVSKIKDQGLKEAYQYAKKRLKFIVYEKEELASVRKYAEIHRNTTLNRGSKPDSIEALKNELIKKGATIEHKELMLNDPDAEYVLLVTHELTLTGAPVALAQMAVTLKKMGKTPIVISPLDGDLKDRFEDIPVIVYSKLFISDLIPFSAELFKLIVISTNVGVSLVAKLNGKKVPVLWWIHEANISYTPKAMQCMPPQLENNIHIYCGGEYASKVLKSYFPQVRTRILLYGVPDYAKHCHNNSSLDLSMYDGKLVFASIGSQEDRKGQDVLAEAVRMLPENLRKKAVFFFIGRPVSKRIGEAISSLQSSFPESVVHIPQLGLSDLVDFYIRMDCLVCSSKDDPLPIVVSDAMSLSKLVICSENTGFSAILEGMNAGLTYRNDSPDQLSRLLSEVISNGIDKYTAQQRNARRSYEMNFTEQVFQKSVETVYTELVNASYNTRVQAPPSNADVSVIIPTYNAGTEFSILLSLLHSQKGIQSVELIIVDSGSTDCTVSTARDYGAEIIQIPQSEFSHSHARNIGAKHATGKYLLFMTQDAMPNGEQWIAGLLQPLLNGLAVAASCREIPRADSDLMGAVSGYFHAGYMGILQADRILRMPEQRDWNSLRQNAQLNDVACVVDAEVFQRFGYLGDYAEDLDLGLRLIGAGYTLALLSSVQVLHSHNRKPSYQMKRCLVENTVLKQLLPDYPMEDLSAQELANCIVTEAAVLSKIESALSTTRISGYKAFYGKIALLFAKSYVSCMKSSVEELQRLIDHHYQDDPAFQEFLHDLIGEYKSSFKLSPVLPLEQLKFIVRTLPVYFRDNAIPFSADLPEQIIDMQKKRLGQISGIYLSTYAFYHAGSSDYLMNLVQQYRKGV